MTLLNRALSFLFIASITSDIMVVIRVNDIETIYVLKNRADQAGIINSLITDAGLTQIPPGTVTCLGMGPYESDKLDEITGEFPLL